MSSLARRSVLRCTVLVNKLLHVPPRFYYSPANSNPSLRNVDLVVKQPLVEEHPPESNFKTLQQLGIETHDKTHTFNLSCNQAIKFIKMGIINKYMASQYCHYVTHLARTLDGELASYYSGKALELALHLGRSGDSLTPNALLTILTEVCSIDSANCVETCRFLLSRQDLIDKLSPTSFSKLLSACYKHKLWLLATELVEANGNRNIMTPFFIDHLVMGMSESATEFKNSDCMTEKNRIKKEVFSHLFRLIEQLLKERVQFITKHHLELELALQQFEVEFKKNPRIKMSGRCTCCNSNIPMYDENITQDLNLTIKNLLHERVHGELLIHTESKDLKKFETFISNLISKDNKPIDIVIDGLNVAYKSSKGFIFFKQKFNEELDRTYKVHKSSSQVQVLVNTILRANLLHNYRKILVLGRSHMSNWPGLVEFFNKNNIHYYFSADHTKDDLFQLYAATFHPRTILVSSDFFRDHLALLGGDKRVMLERWLDTHQAWVYLRNLKIIFPTPFEKIASVDNGKETFHIPVIDFSKLSTIGDHEPPPHLNQKMLTWICGRIGTTGENERN